MELLFDVQGILDNPAVEGGVIDRRAALLHHFFQLTINGVDDISADYPQVISLESDST